MTGKGEGRFFSYHLHSRKSTVGYMKMSVSLASSVCPKKPPPVHDTAIPCHTQGSP